MSNSIQECTATTRARTVMSLRHWLCLGHTLQVEYQLPKAKIQMAKETDMGIALKNCLFFLAQIAYPGISKTPFSGGLRRTQVPRMLNRPCLPQQHRSCV